ncbi:MAG: hypothetical protein ABWZ98_01140, partial [Nakamurella sp.]
MGADLAPRRMEIRTMLHAWRTVPAILRDRHLTVIASNPLAEAVSPALREGVNLARFTFIDSAVDHRLPCWKAAATQVAAMLRDSLDQHDEDDLFIDIVGELSAKSREFAEAWAAESRPAYSGTNVLFNELVGEMRLTYQQLWVPDDYDDAILVWRPVDPHSSMALT